MTYNALTVLPPGTGVDYSDMDAHVLKNLETAAVTNPPEHTARDQGRTSTSSVLTPILFFTSSFAHTTMSTSNVRIYSHKH